MPVDDFAIPRMEPGKQLPIQSMEEARDWERLFIGEIKAGRDPQRPPSRSIHVSTELGDVATFLDAYWERCVKPAGLRSLGSVRSQLSVLKEHLGHLPLAAVEEPDEINRFKTDSEYAEDVELASMHRVLERLRAAINWGMAQTPPLFGRSPFHRFGVRLNKKAEVSRDRRVSREEEKRLLDTALGVMNTPPHQYVGELLHDRIIGALELCCRRGEMLLIQNKRVNWDTHQIGIPGATAKDKENRRIPFNPKGRIAAVLKRRAALGPDAFVFGSANGSRQPTIQTAWETLKLLANGIEPRYGKEGLEWNRRHLQRIDLRWHDMRHEGACRLLADGVDIRIIQLMLGHASIQQTQRYLNVTDEELRKGLEVSWNNQGRPRGLLEASVAADAHARRLEPRVRTSVVHTWFLRADYSRVVATKLEENPYIVALSLAALGRQAEAITALRHLEAKTRTRMRDFMIAARTLFEGNAAESVAAVSRIVVSDFRDPEGLFYLTRHLAHMNETDRALDLFRRVVAGGFFCFPAMARDPWLDSLRGRPEFGKLLRQAQAQHREAAATFARVQGDVVLGVVSPAKTRGSTRAS